MHRNTLFLLKSCTKSPSAEGSALKALCLRRLLAEKSPDHQWPPEAGAPPTVSANTPQKA